MPDRSTTPATARPRTLHILLWTAQWFVAVSFTWAAYVKLTYPVAALAAMWPWTGTMPMPYIRLLGMIDLAGGLGVLLPALARRRSGLTVPAAIGCALLQVAAMMFHALRGEFAVLPVNIAFLGAAVFIAWGRTRRPA